MKSSGIEPVSYFFHFRDVTNRATCAILFNIQETTTKILTDFNPMRYVTISKVGLHIDSLFLLIFLLIFLLH